jgi:hypothetical protein
MSLTTILVVLGVAAAVVLWLLTCVAIGMVLGGADQGRVVDRSSLN